MFDKLKKRIYNSIFLLSLLFALTVSAVSYAVIVSDLYDTQRTKADSSCAGAAQLAATYISQAMRFVENTASRSALSLAASGHNYDVSRELDQLCNYSVEIDGATLYGYDGYMTYSAGMGAAPTLQELRSEPDIREFLAGDARTHISVRASNVAGVYDMRFYNADKGVISCMVKIYENGRPCGVLVADILPDTLFSRHMLYSSFGAACKFVIRAGDAVFTADEEEARLLADPAAAGGHPYLATHPLTAGSTLQMYVSRDGFFRQCLVICGAMLVFLLLLAAVLSRLARTISRNAVAPLEKLNRQMDLTNLPERNP